jgi:hypothetical protein
MFVPCLVNSYVHIIVCYENIFVTRKRYIFTLMEVYTMCLRGRGISEPLVFDTDFQLNNHTFLISASWR